MRPKASTAVWTISRGRERLGDAIGVGDGLAAGLPDFIDDIVRRPGTGGTLAVSRTAEIVDDDARAFLCRQQRDLAPDATARAGDDDDLAVERLVLSHLVSLSAVFC